MSKKVRLKLFKFELILSKNVAMNILRHNATNVMVRIHIHIPPGFL